MTHWNHRVISESYGYHIAEVYYADDGVTPTMWTQEAMAPYGETIGDLRVELNRMLACLDKPILEEYFDSEQNIKLREIA